MLTKNKTQKLVPELRFPSFLGIWESVSNPDFNYGEFAIIRSQAKGLIERTIPEKPTSRLQKYRLTQKGRNILSELKSE